MPYPFLPQPNEYERNWCFWRNGFTIKEIETIVEIGEQKGISRATVGDENNAPNVRQSHVSWIDVSDETKWIYEKLSPIVTELNNEYFGFNLWGFQEDLQYTVYDASRGSEHYDWHVDSNVKNGIARRLSIVMQLSHPHEYEGGELWLHNVTESVMQKEQGIIFAFPSYMLHRVTPVTKGVRRSLVAWVTGFE